MHHIKMLWLLVTHDGDLVLLMYLQSKMYPSSVCCLLLCGQNESFLTKSSSLLQVPVKMS